MGGNLSPMLFNFLHNALLGSSLCFLNDRINGRTPTNLEVVST